MDKSKLDVAQLQKRDPTTWTSLLHNVREEEDVVVTAVSAVPLDDFSRSDFRHRAFRYVLTLSGQSDPITFIGKRTDKIETIFYQNVAERIPFLAPKLLFASLSDDKGWIVIEDIPNHFPPHKWTVTDVEEVIYNLARLHGSFWDKGAQLKSEGFPHFIGQKKYTWQELRADQEIFFEEGPAAAISEHAIDNAGRLAPALLQAANGLTVIRDLGGWPGILSESHLTAAADLIDDPVPMLEPMRYLPMTLVHGNPFSYHWRLTLFDELRLFAWGQAAVAPGVWDLVSFLEQFDLLYDDTPSGMRTRQERPTSEETMVDSYILALSGQLGSQANARAMRQAIPAARCLYVLTNWFPHFAKWFADMPGKFTWQRVNRLSDEQLVGTPYQPMIGLRPYLAGVFKRFLQAYRTL